MADMTKQELNMIDNQLQYEKMMFNKYKAFYPYCSDPQLQIQCQKIAAKHEDNFIQLLNMLQ